MPAKSAKPLIIALTCSADVGTGTREATDYRDLPHVWAKGFHKMDVGRLRARLTTAQLILGDVARTSNAWVSREDVVPIGFIGFDFDYYTSTVHALQVFDGPHRTRLPRVFCYFDDVIWPEHAYYNDFVGELLAINEFQRVASRPQALPPPFLAAYEIESVLVE